MPDEYDVVQIEFTHNVDDVGGITGQRRVLLGIPGSRIGFTGTDVVDEQQAKLALQTVDDGTPQLLITAEAMRQEDKWPVVGTNNLDVVPGIDVHGASLGRYEKSTIDRSPRRENRQAITGRIPGRWAYWWA